MLVAVAVASAANAGTTPRKWYWSETQAEAAVVTKVRLPQCRVYPDDPQCLAHTPHIVGFTLGPVDCRGADELRSTFTFNRFSCRVVARYAPKIGGTIAVYVTGPLTFRWKVLDAYGP